MKQIKIGIGRENGTRFSVEAKPLDKKKTLIVMYAAIAVDSSYTVKDE